ncbi:MAG: ATP-binding protein [Cyanobacteria bacterium P01_A01_bin.135]
MPAPAHPQESSRLDILRQYKIIDTNPEQDYDDITALASYICDAPIALISLVELNRQWFKSKVGLNCSETSRDVSFCSHAILTPELMVVENALADERFANNPLVTGFPGIRFYAGMPLVSPNGHAVGTLCVIDHQPRSLSPAQAQALETLAHQVVAQMELRLALGKLSAQAQALATANQALHQTNFDLDARVKARTSELLAANRRYESLNAELTRSNQELAHLAYVISHDLQEPLRKVRNYSDLLKKRYSNQLDERADKYMGHMASSITRMTQLLKDLLAYSRISRGECRYRPVALSPLLQKVIGELQTKIEQTQATIRFPSELPIVEGNEAKLHQLLHNLIDNSLKFRSDAPPQIDVQAIAVGQFWQISIADNGIGIAPEFLERIFAVFQRLHVREAYEGTGIGLALCKRIVERHGGQIWVESTPGKGATFHVTLPQKAQL